jgi:signal transduction histidine kinase
VGRHADERGLDRGLLVQRQPDVVADRASAALSSDEAGSGLGLAVCRSNARAHGGDVSLMRGERGLIAQVRLPLAYGGR